MLAAHTPRLILRLQASVFPHDYLLICFELDPRLCIFLSCCKIYQADIGLHNKNCFPINLPGDVIHLYMTELAWLRINNVIVFGRNGKGTNQPQTQVFR